MCTCFLLYMSHVYGFIGHTFHLLRKYEKSPRHDYSRSFTAIYEFRTFFLFSKSVRNYVSYPAIKRTITAKNIASLPEILIKNHLQKKKRGTRTFRNPHTPRSRDFHQRTWIIILANSQLKSNVTAAKVLSIPIDLLARQ